MNSHLLPLFISYRSSGEKLINIQQIDRVIVCIILMTNLFYKALILQGEIWCWSLSGLQGLKVLCHEDIAFVVHFFCISTLYLITHTQNAPEELLRRYQEALTIIIIIYLVNFAYIALKLGKVGPTTCISSFNPCPPLPSVAIERFHMTSRWPYWCSKTIKRRPCWCTKPVLWELISFLT